VTWDTAKQIIMDTDPRLPLPLPINMETLALLQLKCVEKVYKIIQVPLKKKKERKRKRQK
jgi:hypothetical protein